jgi:2-dehydropantoate 2-reductase
MTTIAVIGPGAVGGTVAAWLAQGGHEVTLCVRTTFQSLKVETPVGPIFTSPRVLVDPKAARPVDWVLVCVKAYDAAAARPWLAALMGPETRIAVLQNGVEHVSRFASLAPVERIVPCVVDIPAERTAPGRIRQRANGTIIVPEGEAGEAFVALFAASPIAVSTTSDITTALWKKLCINCGGVVSALTMKPGGVIREPGIADLVRGLVAECVAVGRAEGANLGDDQPDFVANQIADAPADAINSIYGDRLAGRPTEIDARNGVIVRLGKKHGIPAPLNAAAVALLGAMG